MKEITWEQINLANESIKTTPIERTDKKTGKKTIKEYAEVNQRIKAFRMIYPMGTIETEIKNLQDGIVVMRAIIKNGEQLLGTGTAFEDENSSFINKTSYIENCETSAVGRALAMCGFGIESSISSAEETENAIENQDVAIHNMKTKAQLLAQISKIMADKKILPNEIYDNFNKKSAEMTNEELNMVINWLVNK